MGKYAKLIAFDIAMAVAIVILYSLGLLTLRPTDNIFLQAGFSIIFAVAILVAPIWVNVETLCTPKFGHRETTGDLIAIPNRHTDRPIVGKYAALAISELQNAERKHEETGWPRHHAETTSKRIRIAHG